MDYEQMEEGGPKKEDVDKGKSIFRRLLLKGGQNLGFDKDEFMQTVRVGDVEGVAKMLADPRSLPLGGVASN